MSLRSNEDATLGASGTVNVPSASKVYRLRSTTAMLKSGGTTRVKLRISRKARGPIGRSLRRGRKFKAKLSLVVKDAAGNSVTKHAAIRLRR